MNCEDARRRLDDYADGSQPELERHENDGHLSGCAACREEAESIRGLLADLKAQPREMAPDADMWPAIAERTGGARTVKVDFRRWARSGAIAAMAAAAVVVIAAVSTLVVEWQTEQLATAMQRREYRAPALLVELRAVHKSYAKSIGQLTTALQHRRDSLSPETMAIVEQNLKTIESAIAEAQEALAADPSSKGLLRAISGLYAAKLRMLRSVGITNG